MKFGSLFAGIGGIDLGLERAGMECIWQVENDEYCTRVLEKHWPEVQRFGDVRECTNLPPVDLIAGGFPCQPHSIAGQRRGAEDNRNLWPEFSRIIGELKPRYVLAENVPGIITTYIDTVLFDLEGQGYTCATFNLPALAFDAPHRRERIFIVAHRDDNNQVRGVGAAANHPHRGTTLGGAVRNWPTPRAGKTTSEDPETWAKRQRAGKVATPPLGMAVKIWPTASSRDWKDTPGMAMEGTNPDGSKRARNDQLARRVYQEETFPTPTSRDHKSGRGKQPRQYSELTPAIERSEPTGRLNPTWVEWLMGFPLGWTDLEDSETP
jgi:DNA (cytosine-5)-methyltransferase 1